MSEFADGEGTVGPHLTMTQAIPAPAAAAGQVPVSDETLLLVREEERRRLLFELHDRVGPTLASIALGLRAARRALEVDPEIAGRLLAELELDVRRGVGELRQLTTGHPATGMRGLGLLVTLRRHVLTLATRTAGTLDIALDLPATLPFLPPAVEIAAYRVACEALTNVIRHANAHSCVVRLWVDDTALCLEVMDDGAGLGTADQLGIGLRSMAERARELGGDFHADTRTDGHGTRVVVRLPCET